MMTKNSFHTNVLVRGKARGLMPSSVLLTIATILVCVMGVGVSPARADFTHDFSSLSGLYLVGNPLPVPWTAILVDQDIDGTTERVRLSPSGDTTPAIGDAWHVGTQDISAGFVTTFDFQISNINGDGTTTDGLAFLLQNTFANNILTDVVPADFGVRFFTNAGGSIVWAWKDSNPVGTPTFLSGIDFTDGLVHSAKITYDPGTTTVGVSVDNQSVLTETIDLSPFTSPTNPYVGFAGQSLAARANNDVLNWTFVNAVPEPTSLALLGLGGLTLLSRRRRSRG